MTAAYIAKGVDPEIPPVDQPTSSSDSMLVTARLEAMERKVDLSCPNLVKTSHPKLRVLMLTLQTF